MTTKRVLFLVGGISIFMLVVTSIPLSIRAAPTAQWTLEGRVYEGDIGHETRPLQAVTVSVYGANNTFPDSGYFIRDTTTGSDGWYGLTVYDTDGLFDYYSLRVTDPTDYTSVGATSVSGTVRTANWIEYAAPLPGQTLTGNKFWDRAPVLSGRIYEGSVGDESRPLAGVTVSLHCSQNAYPDSGSVLTSTTTDGTGWYGLSTYITCWLCDYYHIIPTQQLAYYSVGATSVSGIVREFSWIEYSGSYAIKTLSGNKFWQGTYRSYLSLLLKNP